LAGKQDTIKIALARDTAEYISKCLDAYINGQEIIVTNTIQEVTPTEASKMMGMSRPQVRKIMDSGALPYRMVGSHYRIAVTDINDFMDNEQKRRRAARKRYAELQNELGL
jgi:excisionase family DNA binding protein